MGYVDPIAVGSSGALILGGVFLVFWGVHARRHGKLHTRQGAEVLPAFAAIIGAAITVGGTVLLIRLALAAMRQYG